MRWRWRIFRRATKPTPWLFTNFVTQFPTNELAPLAQWWVADHFSAPGDRGCGEELQIDFSKPELAEFAAGLAGADDGRARGAGPPGLSGRHRIISRPGEDTNCPPELLVPARFAYGSTLMLMNSSDTNNPAGKFSTGD